jgi:transcriptional regulator with XRE-family HTH domain
MTVMGDRLRDGRELKGLTQDALAELVGVHRASISNWENGGIPRRHLAKVRKLLSLDEQLRPLDAPTVAPPRDMDDPELMAEFNLAMSRANELANEINHRMTGAEVKALGDAVRRRATRSSAPRHAHESPTAVHFESLDSRKTANGYSEQTND